MKHFLKYIYQTIPFKQELFSFIRKFYVPPESVYKHLHFKGIIKVQSDENTFFKMRHYGYELENEVFWKGLNEGWEKISVGLWKKLCRDSSVIVDVGSNTGIYALIAKSLNKNATVYALEPVKRVYEKLVENNLLNHFDIQCLEVAASDTNGTAKIFDPEGEHVYSVTINKNWNAFDVPVKEVEIKTITLDTLIEQNKISKIDLIKIDVETHEPQVMEGFKKHLKAHHPTILIEILMDGVGEKVEAILKECGCEYLFFNIDEKHGIRRVDHIVKSDFFNYLLCSEPTARQLELI